MALYKLPLGIRIPRDDEYPNNYDVKAINDKRNQGNIIEGYTIKEAKGEKFSHYLELNVDADKIWDVFCAVVNNIIGNEAYGVIGLRDAEPKLSDFTTRENLIHLYEKFAFELINDGFLKFGIATYDEKSLNEVFVTSFKYIRIWTDKIDTLLDTLNTFKIPYVENLHFIDEFPVVSEAISNEKYIGMKSYSEVMENIQKEFESYSYLHNLLI